MFFSRIYDCKVVHSRNLPIKRSFTYHYYCFCLDLDEIHELSKKSLLFGLQYWKIFRFSINDFIFGKDQISINDTKERIISYAYTKGVEENIKRVELVAHMRTFGFAFNPAAFYFCYSDSSQDSLACAVLEVTNTYREKKTYFIQKLKSNNQKSNLESSHKKNFYVSPFMELDSVFDCDFEISQEKLKINILSSHENNKKINAFLTGKSLEINDLNLIFRVFKNPFVTLSVIFLIHWQALKLYFKKVPFIRKKDQPLLQQGGIR